MKMFVANLTEQNHDFQYRVPGSTKLIKQEIPAGTFIRVSGDLTTLEIETIIRQHAPYGLIEHGEIDRAKPFVGLCYSLDKPMRLEEIKRGIEHNHSVLDLRGKEIRRDAAVSVGTDMAQQDRNFQALEASVLEVTKDKDSEVNETIRVDKNGPAKPTTTRRAAA